MLRTVSIYLHAAIFIFAGVMHFVRPKGFIDIVPAYLPYPAMLVYISGVAEIAGGVGLLIPQLRRYAAWGLLLLLLAVFPANINMAIHRIPLNGTVFPDWALWGRLPLQFLLMAWIWWASLR